MTVKSICGLILISEDPQALANFYQAVLGLTFEPEEHGGLATHFGVDIGEMHFGIHPPSNFQRAQVGNASTVVAFNVDSIAGIQAKALEHGATEVIAPNDEGFGMVATYRDPQGNLFELVELDYEFNS